MLAREATAHRVLDEGLDHHKLGRR